MGIRVFISLSIAFPQYLVQFLSGTANLYISLVWHGRHLHLGRSWGAVALHCTGSVAFAIVSHCHIFLPKTRTLAPLCPMNLLLRTALLPVDVASAKQLSPSMMLSVGSGGHVQQSTLHCHHLWIEQSQMSLNTNLLSICSTGSFNRSLTCKQIPDQRWCNTTRTKTSRAMFQQIS